LTVVLSVALALAAGLALRLWMLNNFFEVNGDSLLYGELAKNLLTHGLYAFGQTAANLNPTLIRLPGYPLFLAACFHAFGMENYASAPWVQIAMDLAGCLLLAGFVGLIAPPALKSGAAQCTLWLAALCPFTAIYAAEPMSEAPTLFCLALALWSAAWLREQPRWAGALWFTFAVTFAALLRPDGVLVAVALAPAIVIGVRRRDEKLESEKPAGSGKAPNATRMALVCLLLALAPFAAWTWRNWQVFHVFEPLAPRMATDPGEDTHPGFERWVKTWCLDFNSTYEIYWNVPSGPLEISKLPGRAFDSAAQYAATTALAADYNSSGQELTHAIDERFAALAAERVATHPLRYYVVLPLGRVTDMWLRPRIENLPIDMDWWVYKNHHRETCIAWALVALNALYLLLAVVGLCLRPRMWGAMLAYMLLRSAMLLSVAAPEARYTVECFPMLFALGGIGVWWGSLKMAAVGKRLTE
jgi:hypothetical protein